jgi:hypothetical protein
MQTVTHVTQKGDGALRSQYLHFAFCILHYRVLAD